MSEGKSVRYVVRDREGEIVNPGDIMVSFRDVEWIFERCVHPNKITVYQGDPDGIWPAKLTSDFYASVFDASITVEGDENCL
ncbi:hypothetical protein [Kutzneria chonburiensis]|uniref:Uncharacterized protein n=1 Tax=Kutzneria chonburiensis TaxID=1483604 RepID=A0ABV6N4R0_9PSEU|nr:hypothetical protein [Kutzneria chonburiensis]